MTTGGKKGVGRLYKIDSVADFALAIAGGADVNETVQGKPLVLWLWNQLRSCTDPEDERTQNLLKKLEVLETLGVDLSVCVWNDLHDLTYHTQINFIRIERLLKSSSSRRAIYRSEYYMNLIRSFRNSLKNMEQLMDELEPKGNT